MPRYALPASVVLVLCCSLLLTPVTTYGTAANHVLISEVLYDPDAAEPGAEWIELLNPTAAAIDLGGWTIQDNAGADTLPAATLAPGQRLVIAANGADFLAANPGFSGAMVSLGSPLGNGLSNSGDRLTLLDAGGAAVDALSYGSDSSIFSPSCPDVPEGQSLARLDSGDTDAAGDWTGGAPTPGQPPGSATATPTTPDGATATPVPPTATATPTIATPETPFTTPTLTPSPASWPRVLLSEVYYDSPQAGTDSAYEFIELFNPGPGAVALEGWRLADNTAEDALPAVTLPASQYLVVAATHDGFAANFGTIAGPIVYLEGTIGNGLGNTGDAVQLLTPNGVAVDAMSYGSDVSAFDPACPDVEAGQSLARLPSGRDTNARTDWLAQGPPNPGQPPVSPTPTPNPSRTPTATPAPPTATPTGTDAPSATPSGTPTPTPIVTPGPGETPSETPAATPSPTPTAIPVLTETPTPGATWTPDPSQTPTQEPSPPVTHVFLPEILLSEVLYDAVQAGPDAEFEWVELLNRTYDAVTLDGWRLADNVGDDLIPRVTIAAQSYVVVTADAGSFALNHPGFTGQIVNLDSSIGNGLANDGDAVRLLAPDGRVADAMSYGADASVFDPPCQDVAAGYSLARSPAAEDSDTAAEWSAQAVPNPGEPAPLATPTPPPTVTPTVSTTATPPLPPGALQVYLNEILPDPAHVDWDHNGEPDFLDEWIELYSDAEEPVSLSGWILSDDAATYTIPPGTVIWPRSHLLLYRSQTRLSLGDWRDVVDLMRSDGSIADGFLYDRGPGEDRSFCRYEDGAGEWRTDCEVTPGEANRLRPPSPTSVPAPVAVKTALPTTIAAARRAPLDTRVTITGTVTLPPGLIGKTIYVQDDTGGIKVYLRSGDYGQLGLGDRVRVVGWTRDFYGEMEISVPDPGYLTWLGQGTLPAPLPLTAAGLREEHEGLLVQVVGAVTKFEPRGLVLRDQQGAIPIYFPESLPWRRPYVEIGEVWAAQGVLAQHLGEGTAGTGYQVIPRFKSDVIDAPAFLPVTGRAGG